MKPDSESRRTFLKSAALGAAGGGSARAAPSAERLRLWYRRPAADWNEALPIGNGRLGAMVFGGVAEERLQINDDTLYSDEPGQRDIPIDITKTFGDVLSLMRARKYAEAEAIMNRHWIGRVWPCYQPLGDLYMAFDGHGSAAEYERELDLSEAVCRVRYRMGGTLFEREILASHPDDLIVIRLTASGPASLRFTARFASAHPTARMTRAAPDAISLRGQAPGLAVRRTLEWIEQRGDQWKYPELWDKNGKRLPHARPVLYAGETGGRGMFFEARLAAKVRGGPVSASDKGLRVEGAREALLLLSAATSFNGFDKSPSREGADPAARARATITAASGKSFARIRAAHAADYRKLFGRVSLSLGGTSAQGALPTDERIQRFGGGGDAALAALYFQFGRYLLIAGSRPGTQPLNLQGLWNQEVIPPWASGYTININTEMNYWLAEAGNLAECHEPLFRLIRELAVSGRRTARQMYGRRGWVSHHNTTLWRSAQPVDNAAMPSFWPMSSGWLCEHLWEHYLFGGDVRFLGEVAYPLMKGAAEFYLDWLVEDSQGRLLTPAGVSPETGFFYIDGRGVRKRAGVTMGPTMDLAIIRELFTNCIEAAKVLNRDGAFRGVLEDRLARLLPYQVGGRGQLQEWAEDLEETDPKHRHISHLYALHPANHITPRGDARLAAAARRTLELRGDEGTGWSRAWKINFWARLEDGDHAYMLVKKLLTPAKGSGVRRYGGGVLPNLFCSHPPFQIDGNFGGAAGIAEMLLQSHAGEIHLLPALPAAWPAGSVRGLRGRGGFEVSMEWRRGVLVAAGLHSTLGRRCKLRYRDTVVEFPTVRGRTYRLDPALRRR